MKGDGTGPRIMIVAGSIWIEAGFPVPSMAFIPGSGIATGDMSVSTGTMFTETGTDVTLTGTVAIPTGTVVTLVHLPEAAIMAEIVPIGISSDHNSQAVPHNNNPGEVSSNHHPAGITNKYNLGVPTSRYNPGAVTSGYNPEGIIHRDSPEVGTIDMINNDKEQHHG